MDVQSSPVAREACRVRIGLEEQGTGRPVSGIDDVRVLVTLPGRWQHSYRADARTDAGMYAFEFTPPRAGLYVLYVDSGSDGPAARGTSVLHLKVVEKSIADDK